MKEFTLAVHISLNKDHKKYLSHISSVSLNY